MAPACCRSHSLVLARAYGLSIAPAWCGSWCTWSKGGVLCWRSPMLESYVEAPRTEAPRTGAPRIEAAPAQQHQGGTRAVQAELACTMCACSACTVCSTRFYRSAFRPPHRQVHKQGWPIRTCHGAADRVASVGPLVEQHRAPAPCAGPHLLASAWQKQK